MIVKCMLIPTLKEDLSVPMNGRGIGPGIPCFRNTLKGQMLYLYSKRWGGKDMVKIKHTSAMKTRIHR